MGSIDFFFGFSQSLYAAVVAASELKEACREHTMQILWLSLTWALLATSLLLNVCSAVTIKGHDQVRTHCTRHCANTPVQVLSLRASLCGDFNELFFFFFFL